MYKRICKKIIGLALIAAMVAGSTPADIYAVEAKKVNNVPEIVEELSEEETNAKADKHRSDSESVIDDYTEENLSEEDGDDSDDESDSSEHDIIAVNPFEEGEREIAELPILEDNSGIRGYIPSAEDYSVASIYDNLSKSEEIEATKYFESLPSKYDTRDEIEIPVVRNQNPYGSCWSHSINALAEINLIKKNIADKTIDLSEMQTAVFAYTNVTDPLGGTANDKVTYLASEPYVDAGGNVNFAKDFLASWKGYSDESSVPYNLGAGFQSQIAGTKKLAYEYDKIHLKGFKSANIITERVAVKKLIMEYGAVSVSYCDANDYYDETHNSYYCDTKYRTNHAVTVIGWDDAFPKEDFLSTPSENGAWLIRNSWGNNGYGHNGYFWISYCDMSLSDNSTAVDVEYSNDYDNNYQYDGGFGLSGVGYGEDTIYGANIFTAHASDNDPKIKSEIIKAVSFETAYANLEYEIKVYTNLTDESNPVSGTLEDTVSGVTDYSGYYTVPLSKNVNIAEGAKYSVVLKLHSKDGSKVSLPIDCRYTITDLVTTTPTGSEGESFLSDSGIYFEDISTSWNNAKIKAFTDNVYTLRKYKIEYVINTGICCGINNNANPTYYYELSDDIVLADPVAYSSDITFEGWYKDKELTNKVTKISKDFDGNITLYAKWNMPTYITGDCIAKLDQYGKLTVSGSGATDSYTENGQPWFKLNNCIKEIVFEEGVTSIGSYFAYKFDSVKRVVIPKSVNTIGSCAFQNCKVLDTIEYNAASVTGQNLFFYGYNTPIEGRKLIIGEDVTAIGLNSFSDACISEIIWPENCKVTQIGSYAFYVENTCQCFEEVTIPASVTSIRGNAFGNNKQLNIIRFMGNPSIGSDAFYTSENVDTIIYTSGTDTSVRGYDWSGSNRNPSYKAMKYTITYNLDGGTNADSNQSTFDGTKDVFLYSPTKTGYIFGGFYRKKDFSDSRISVIPSGTKENIVLYAKWTVCNHSGSLTRPSCTSSSSCSVCKAMLKATGHFMGAWTVTKSATCVKEGVQERTCLNTGCTYKETDTVAATGVHTLGEWTETKAPTCVKEGEKTRICTNAGCTYKETDTVASTGVHTLGEWTEIKAPTCLEKGTKERTCKNTGCTYKETEDIAATGHTLGEWTETKAPTCVKEGEKTRICTNVGCTYKETDTVAATGVHTLGEWTEIKAPTCSEKGTKERTCKNTGCTYKETEDIAATGHTLGEWTETKAPTCVKEGEKTRICTNAGCTYKETEEIAATGHTLSGWTETKAPTCVKEGEKTRICTNAGCTYKETEEIAATGVHTLGEWTEIKAPTCSEKGAKERTCKNAGCTYKETEDIAATGHTLGEWTETKAPTCVKEGEKTRICTNAGCTYKETEEIAATGVHTLGEWTEIKAPTCSEKGAKERTCKNEGCTYRETEDIAATGIHSLTEWTEAKAPTCTEDGEKERHCKNTGCTYNETVAVKAIGHLLTNSKIIKKPTCTENGEREVYCSNVGCTYSETEQILPLGHSMTVWQTTKNPTCTEDGEKEKHCNRTGCTYSETDIIKAKGHSLTEWNVVKNPTCTEKGKTERHCMRTNCTYNESDEVKELGHSYGEWKTVKNPTCTEEGLKERECSRCHDRDSVSIPVIAEGFQVVLQNEDDLYYHPKGVQPDVTVYFNGEILVPSVDYKVSYRNNKKAGTKDSTQAPSVIVSGAGRFTKSYVAKYTINQVDIGTLSYSDEMVVSKKTAVKPQIYHDGVLLKTSDYDVYKIDGGKETKLKSGEKLAESCELVIKAKPNGNYVGEVNITCTVSDAVRSKMSVNQSSEKLYYNGTEQFPSISVFDSKDKTKKLVENEDYIVHYPINAVNAGSYVYVVEGIGEYTGTITKKYSINGVVVGSDDIDISYDDAKEYIYNPLGTTLSDVMITAYIDGEAEELKENVDYTIKYSSNKKISTSSSKAKCVVSFIGNYKGTKSKTLEYDIIERSLDDATVTIPDKTKCGAKGVFKVAPIVDVDGVVLKSSCYNVKYYLDEEMTSEMTNSNPVIFDEEGVKTVYVDIEGKGNYADKVSDQMEYHVYCKNYAEDNDVVDLSLVTVEIIKDTYDPEYDGNSKEPKVIVKQKNGNIVAEDDYNCYYSNNVLKGTATIIINGDGVNTIGSKTKTFAIKAKQIDK